MKQALEDQIGLELESAYQYLSMAAYFDSTNLPGFARWMRVQAREELDHGMRLFDSVLDRGQRPRLHALAEPRVDFGSPLEACTRVLEHERSTTESIHRVYALARDLDDYPAQVMLHWFVDEQVEEEKLATRLVESVRRAGDDAGALLVLDSDLGRREIEPST